MEPIRSTDRNATQHAMIFKPSPNHLGPCTSLWTAWLQLSHIIPICCLVEIHVQPEVQKIYGAHSVAGCYVGTYMVHYRGQRNYVTETNGIWVGDTIFCKHKYLTIPTRTKANAVEYAAKDLQKAIDGGIPKSNIDRETLDTLMDILKKNVSAYKDKGTRWQRV